MTQKAQLLCYTGAKTHDIEEEHRHGFRTTGPDLPVPCHPAPDPTPGPPWAMQRAGGVHPGPTRSQEEHQVLQSLVQQVVTSAAAPVGIAAMAHITIAKMGPQYDLEAFLELFDHVWGCLQS